MELLKVFQKGGKVFSHTAFLCHLEPGEVDQINLRKTELLEYILIFFHYNVPINHNHHVPSLCVLDFACWNLILQPKLSKMEHFSYFFSLFMHFLWLPPSFLFCLPTILLEELLCDGISRSSGELINRKSSVNFGSLKTLLQIPIFGLVLFYNRFMLQSTCPPKS